jgi:hypothetical protein
MKTFHLVVLTAFLTLPVMAEAEPLQPGTSARVVDQYGNTRHDLPSLRLGSDLKWRVVDAYGNTRHDLPSVKVDRDGKARVVDPYGNTRHDLPSVTGMPK